MHDVAVRVGGAEWRDWLLHLADTRTLRRLEVPGDLLEPDPCAVLRLAQHVGLSVLHVPDAIPPTLSRYASETGLADNAVALASLAAGLQSRVKGGVLYTSVDLGLDRLALECFADGLRRRNRFLRALRGHLEPLGVSLAIRVRWPRPFPGSHEWEWAGNLLHELRSERCFLAVDVVMQDLPEDFRVEGMLRDCAAHLAVVRLHYRPGLSECPSLEAWERWAAALRHHAARLAIVFCPQEPPLASAAEALAAIEGWAGAM